MDETRTEIRISVRALVEFILREGDLDNRTTGKTDLTVLRLAVYEMEFDEDVPVGVAVNEAVELSKKFGGDGSPAFVNGILDKVKTTLTRPFRTAVRK